MSALSRFLAFVAACGVVGLFLAVLAPSTTSRAQIRGSGPIGSPGGGGGISSAAAAATFLKIDGSNDPVTAGFSVIPSSSLSSGHALEVDATVPTTGNPVVGTRLESTTTTAAQIDVHGLMVDLGTEGGFDGTYTQGTSGIVVVNRQASGSSITGDAPHGVRAWSYHATGSAGIRLGVFGEAVGGTTNVGVLGKGNNVVGPSSRMIGVMGIGRGGAQIGTGVYAYLANSTEEPTILSSEAALVTDTNTTPGGDSIAAHVGGVEAFVVGPGGVVEINSTGTNTGDLVVSTDTASNGLFVDASANSIGFFSGSPDADSVETGRVIIPSSDDTIDLGTSALAFRTLYVDTSIVGGSNSKALAISDADSVQVSSGGLDTTFTSTGRVQMPLSASTTWTSYLRLPGSVYSGGGVSAPTCNSTAAAAVVYVDRIGDGVAASVCVCAANAADAYAWRRIDDLTTSCDVIP